MNIREDLTDLEKEIADQVWYDNPYLSYFECVKIARKKAKKIDKF